MFLSIRRGLPVAFVVLMAVAFTACAGDSPAAVDPPPASPPPASTGQAESAQTDSVMSDSGMDMSGTHMGDPDTTPAWDVAGADIAEGMFVLLDTAPDGYRLMVGRAGLARHDDGTTVSVELAGLAPSTSFIAHVHTAGCAVGGGDHFKFDATGSDMPPNEIHLAFVSDVNGGARMSATNAAVVGDDANSIVVHPVDAMDAKLACADFAEDGT